jgi:hypothetical protein
MKPTGKPFWQAASPNKEAGFPTVKSLDSFEFTAIPSLNKALLLELARCEYLARRENAAAC